jgi:hypothetical protein
MVFSASLSASIGRPCQASGPRQSRCTRPVRPVAVTLSWSTVPWSGENPDFGGSSWPADDPTAIHLNRGR